MGWPAWTTATYWPKPVLWERCLFKQTRVVLDEYRAWWPLALVK
ncbi:hypothetical protein QGN32_22775 [Mycolicibacterium sp. ND9-15]|nr:hypothetical protein [Mycolicibacterium sp. ND9-15]WSE56134.1 hypothetical protein QGN32_22775 [Mycolicibacterium sp. ND9-15]